LLIRQHPDLGPIGGAPRGAHPKSKFFILACLIY